MPSFKHHVLLVLVGRSEEARVQRARADIVTYQDSVDLYAIDNNDRYPQSLRDLVGGKRDYIRKYAKDPWGNEYTYVVPGKFRPKSYDIYSMGPDGQPNTADDITSWGED